MVEGSDLKCADIYGKVAQSFRATHLIPVLPQSVESANFIASKVEREKGGGTTERYWTETLHTSSHSERGSENVLC